MVALVQFHRRTQCNAMEACAFSDVSMLGELCSSQQRSCLPLLGTGHSDAMVLSGQKVPCLLSVPLAQPPSEAKAAIASDQVVSGLTSRSPDRVMWCCC